MKLDSKVKAITFGAGAKVDAVLKLQQEHDVRVKGKEQVVLDRSFKNNPRQS
jgi:hypothetical protein